MQPINFFGLCHVLEETVISQLFMLAVVVVVDENILVQRVLSVRPVTEAVVVLVPLVLIGLQPDGIRTLRAVFVGVGNAADRHLSSLSWN